MSFSPGQFITAQRLNRLQPKLYRSVASSALTGGAANLDVPGSEIAFSTEAANATVRAMWNGDARNTGGGGGQQASYSALLDGSVTSDVFSLFQGSAANERSTVGNCWDTTIASAGAHTIKLKVTQGSNQTQQTYTTLQLWVQEVV